MNTAVNLLGKWYWVISIFSSIFIFLYLVTLKNIDNLKQELKVIIQNMEEDKNDQEGKLEILEYLYEKTELTKERWRKYYNENEDELLNDVIPSIDNYINYRLIDDVVNRDLMYFVPMMFTALGILGTFFGLYYGISGITIGTASETTQSIGKLMSGISSAFLTSLFGIAYSLLWNMLLKIKINTIENFIDNVNEKFNKVFNSRGTENILEAILKKQEEQTLAMNTMAEDLSIKLAKTISGELEKAIVPSIDKMVETVGGNQLDGMDNIVNNFIENMNDSMGNQFEELGKTIKEIVEWQKQIKNELNSLILEIQSTGKMQISMNKESKELLEMQKENNQLFMESNNAFNEKINNMKSLFDEVNDNVKGLKEINESMVHYDEEIKLSVKKFVESSVATERKVDNILSSFNEIESNFVESSDVFSKSLQESLNSTFELFDNNLSSITGQLSNNISELDEVLNDIPGILKIIKINFDDINDKIEKISIVEETK